MDKQDKIDDLFRIAREQEPITSFDETKERFLNSLGQLPTNQTPKNVLFFNFKKWRIMLSSIIIAGITIAFLNQGDVKTENKRKTTSKMEVKEKQILIQNKIRDNKRKTSEIILSKNETQFNLSGNILSENKYVNEIVSFGPIRNKYQQIPFDDTLKKDVLLFPKLTTKEIDCNNKQKKEMLKSIAKFDKNKFALIPSGSFNYNNKLVSLQGFYMQKTEVSNLEYRTFLFDLLIHDRKEDYFKAIPNQKKWVIIYGEETKPMESMYFNHIAYNNYPVCNISREGAEIYCTWLIQELMKTKYPNTNIQYNDARIPSRIEWVYAASNLGKYNIYPWGTDSFKNTSGNYLANFKPLPDNYFIDGGFHTVKTISYNPNNLGLYCMSGNVAEMVYNVPNSRLEPGTAGGSWADNSESLKIYGKDNYDGLIDAHPNIGFRFVMTYSRKM